MKILFFLIFLLSIPKMSLGSDSIVNFLYSKYSPLIISGKKLDKKDIKSILINVKNQNTDPYPFYMLDTNIRNNKININDLKKSGCKFQKSNLMKCNSKGGIADIYLDKTKILKIIIKYNPRPIFNKIPANKKDRKNIENFSRDLLVELYNRKNFQNIKYYNMGRFIKVEMNYD